MLAGVLGAAQPDPRRAAFEGLCAAMYTYGDAHPDLLDEIRRAFLSPDGANPSA
ncbi:MAG: hypothetical protein ACRDZ8_06005 [Acidimicrobiales bacterium]